MSETNIVGKRINKLQQDINDLITEFTEETGLFVNIDSPGFVYNIHLDYSGYADKFRVEVKPA